MSVLFDGANKAPKVDAYDVARDLAENNVEPTDISPFTTPDPEFNAALKWASRTLDNAGVGENDIDPSLGEIMRAAFQQENTIGSFAARAIPEDDTPSITPDELYTRVNNEGMLPFLDHFRGARTEGEYEAIKANIQREQENRDILDAAGWGGTFAMLGAAVADPINFVPVGGAAVRVAKLANRGGRAAIESALAGTMASGLAEAGLQESQELRTAAETVSSIAAGTVLGGTLGFAVDRVFGNKIAQKAYDHYDNVRTGNAKTGVGAQVVGDLDAQLDARFADDERIGSLGVNASLEVFEKIPVIGKHLASPARVLARSYSGAARMAMKMLVSDPTISRANAAGRKSLDNVEAAFGQVKGQFGQARNEIQSIFDKHKTAYETEEWKAASRGSRVLGKVQSPREVFNTKVARALANGDKSDDPVVAQAAKVLRDRVYNPIRQALVDNNVFTKEEAELLNAESYFPLVYSPDGVRGDEDAFLEFHEAVFSRTIFEDARQALIERDIRKSNIEDEIIAHKGVRQLVPKVDENGQPVINPKTGRQVMTEKIIAKGKVRELREIAKQTFKAEEAELKAEHKAAIKAFNNNEGWIYAGPSQLDNPFHKQFEARDKVREKQAKIDADLKEKKEVENFKLEERYAQIRTRANEKAEAGIDKNISQARKSGQALEKELAAARKETQAKIRDLEAKADKQKAPLDKEIDDLAKEIDEHYGKRIAEARKSQDEAIDAAEDTAVAAILKARGVELAEGYKSILAKYTRGSAPSDELIAKEAAARARQLYTAIVNGVDPMLEHEAAAGLRGYTKTRKNPADHVTLMDKGWALSDVMSITDRYTKTAGMDSVIGQFFRREADKLDETGAKVFDADGNVEKIQVADVGLSTIKKKIRDEYDGMLARAVPDDVTEKLTKKYRNDPKRLETELKAAKTKYEKQLLARRDEDLEALETVLNFARGRSPNSPTQRLRETAEKVGIFNYVRLMGGQIVSSLGDPLNLVISQGFGNTIRHGIVPILKDFSAALRSADGEARRLARLSGANLEMEFNATMAEIGGFTNPWVTKDKMQVWRTAAEKFSTLNGIKYWNTLWKQVAYNTTQARLIENASKGWGALSKSERAWLANLGVDANRLNDFKAAFSTQSSKTVAGGMPLARWDEWADKATGEAFRAAVYKESFNVVITPGLYDKLNAHSDPVGRMILQFRNHMFANTARLTARNVQLAGLGMDKAASAMTGLVGLVMMGALIDALKQGLGDVTATGDTVSGKEQGLDAVISRWQDAPAQSLYNSLDRAGWAGPVLEGSNILHSTSGAGLQDMLRLLSGEENIGSSRIGGRSMLDVAGGATAGALSDIIMSTKAGVSAALDEDKDLTLGDVKRMERLGLPMSLPYLRPLINEFNQYVGTMYDWPTGH